MKHQALDIYDEMPKEMKAYLSNYGWNFNKKACKCAVKAMKRKNRSTGKEEPIEPWSKEQVEDLLTRNGIKLENDVLYNSTYVCNMALADYWQSSIMDETYLALFIKDFIDDPDGCSELPFRYWLQKCIAMGEPIDWEDIL